MTTLAWARGDSPAASVKTVLGFCLVLFVALAAAVPGFASPANVEGFLVSALPLLLLATGQTFVLISGGIDLSAPAIVGLASVAGGLVMSADGGLLAGSPGGAPAGAAVMVTAGAALGLVNGVCVGVLRMPAFMVTLTVGMFAGGASVLLVRLAANTETMFNLPAAFTAVGRTPAAALLACGGALAAHAVLSSTVYGRMLQAAGYNSRAAAVSGVRVPWITAAAYGLSGAFAALAAVLLTASLETASPTHGRPLLLDVIGATVIGGTSLSGGRGHIAGTALGVLFLAMLGNGLTLLNLSDFVITIVKGAVILVAAILDRFTAAP